MGKQGHKSFILIAILTLFFVGALGLIAGFFMVNATVEDMFGPPSPNLALTQRLFYPLELFINQEKLTQRQSTLIGEKIFEVGQGESVSMVCLRLEQAGLIRDAELMRIYLIYSGLDRHLQSGRFVLDGNMTPLQVAAELMDATPRDAVINILPGWRIEEIAENVAGSGLGIEAELFIETAYNPQPHHFSYLPVETAPTLEGFLYPGSYSLPREAELDELFEAILMSFAANLDAHLIDGFTRQGLTVYDAVILASIVEREAIVEDEKPLIASVFLNRLGIGMRLETDPTVQYALGFDEETGSWWKSPLFLTDLTVESPYNTYLINGLPPTPISNPDLSSLRSVAYPAETPYFFFRAACDESGRHNFAITFEEHLENRCD